MALVKHPGRDGHKLTRSPSAAKLFNEQGTLGSPSTTYA